jgi:hypothetical protein
MKSNEVMMLSLTRKEIILVIASIANNICGLRDELNKNQTVEEIIETAESIERCSLLREKIIEQLFEPDAK